MKKDIYVKKSKFGKGIFANRNFKKGETICFLEGKRAGLEVIQALKKKKREILVDPLQISDDQYIDLNEPYLYINHSCGPNAGIKGENQLFALKHIKKGEEIFFDYSTTMDEGIDCQCGSKKCRGKIGDFFTLPKSLQNKYIKLGAIPDFIRKKTNCHVMSNKKRGK